MKQAILFSFLLGLTLFSNGQAPQAINYQSVLRDSLGLPQAEEAIGVKFTIQQGTNPDTIVYVETNTAMTNQFGLFTLAIGEGEATFSLFSDINWATGNKYLMVEIDRGLTGNYVSMGNSQLLSVPYALFSGTSGKSNQVIAANNDSLSLSSGPATVAMAGNIKGYSNEPGAAFGWPGGFTIDSVIFSLDILHTVMFHADVSNWGNGSECAAEIELSFDGTEESGSLVLAQNHSISGGAIDGLGNNSTILTTSWMKTLSAGTHVVRLLGNYTGSCSLFQTPHINVLVLGN